jgi:hypothetical protein
VCQLTCHFFLQKLHFKSTFKLCVSIDVHFIVHIFACQKWKFCKNFVNHTHCMEHVENVEARTLTTCLGIWDHGSMLGVPEVVVGSTIFSIRDGLRPSCEASRHAHEAGLQCPSGVEWSWLIFYVYFLIPTMVVH